MKLSLSVPADFNLHRTIYSHGWSSLPPFSTEKNRILLSRADELPSGGVVFYSISQPKQKLLTIDVVAKKGAAEHRSEILRQVKSCLLLDEDYSEFYRVSKKYPHFRWTAKTGAGRLLRAPSVFEDAVKMICTTNCSWALTKIMVNNLCRKLGKKIAADIYTFPSPKAVARVTEAFLRKEIKAGYRAPYLLELSRRIVNGDLDMESWRISTKPTPELYDEVTGVKGIGPYAAANILKLIGRYDYLGIDSWCRKQFSTMYKEGRKVSERTIEKFYNHYGAWRGLFFWLDL